MSRLTESAEWKALEVHRENSDRLPMRKLFEEDPSRFDKFSVRFNDILLDYSKNRVTEETMGLLFQLARSVGLAEYRDRMFSGARINSTEGRALLLSAGFVEKEMFGED